MKTWFSLFVLILALVNAYRVSGDSASPNDWGPVTNDFLMSIELKNGVHEITNGQPCVLAIRFKNVSKSKTLDVLRLLWVEGDGTYSFTVLDPSGKDISPVPRQPSGGSGGAIEVTPGQTGSVEFKLSSICKIGSTGNYKVIARKRVWSSDGKFFQMVSNPLIFCVVPSQ